MNRIFSSVAAGVFVMACAARPASLVTPEIGALSFAAHARQVVPLTSGDPARGRAAFIDLRCHACHRVAGDDTLPVLEGAAQGPLLRDLGKDSPEAVGWKIVTQSWLDAESLYETEMVEASSSMTERQLVDLIAYLRAPVAPAKR